MTGRIAAQPVQHPRIVFAGTPAFACPALQALIDHARPIAVLTQPDRPAGRGRRIVPGPVKALALEAGIPVHQPRTLRDDRTAAWLIELAPELIVTAAYGLLVPKKLLDLPRLGCWNLHASLLPRWRGASPIQQAILAGDRETGVTLMKMDEGLDTGPMLIRRAIPIRPRETAGELHDRLATLAAEVLIDGLKRLVDGTLPDAVAQDPRLATHAPRIDKRDAAIDWTRDADHIERQVHAYNPWPVAHAELAGQPVRIFRARADLGTVPDARPGTLLTGRGHPDRIRVACGRGVLEIDELQAPGRRRQSATDWLNAHPDWRG
ncbi:MAG: methionyl-tRNA formyltransferase [Wenzhouxiangellaceae bacterium]